MLNASNEPRPTSRRELVSDLSKTNISSSWSRTRQARELVRNLRSRLIVLDARRRLRMSITHCWPRCQPAGEGATAGDWFGPDLGRLDHTPRRRKSVARPTARPSSPALPCQPKRTP